jgi:ATP phosphoribosyltransferase
MAPLQLSSRTDSGPFTPVDSPVGTLSVALPKGRMGPAVFQLLQDAGIHLNGVERGYRPDISLPDTDAKIMKPQNVLEMLSHGTRDVGFAGHDWVNELNVDVVEVLDTGLDPIRLVAAAPISIIKEGLSPDRRWIVASEYERVSRRWIDSRGLSAEFLRSYGATEVFPPDDADIIIDNTATGSTLRANGLEIMDVLMESSTRLFASTAAMSDPWKRKRIEAMALIIKSVLEARGRVMIEMNAVSGRLNDVVELLPSMREATVAPLYGDSGYAVRAAVPLQSLPTLIPCLKEAGATDLVVSTVSQIIP